LTWTLNFTTHPDVNTWGIG